VLQDIQLWSKKVGIGGIISGHDYQKRRRLIHVKEALHAYTAAFEIYPWFTLGRAVSGKNPNFKQDKVRSWMWVKQ
jgi:hypothetical protein